MAEEKVGETIRGISDDVKGLIQAEVELAKSELGPAAKHGGIGAGLFAGSGYLAHHAAGIFFIFVALLLFEVAGLPLWASFLIVFGALLLVAGILGLVGYLQIKKVKGPEKTIAQGRTTVADVQAAIKRGLAAAKAPQIEGTVVARGDSDLAGATALPRK